MKVLFVQFEPQESLAIQYLSAFLKKFGHVTDLLIVGNMSFPRIAQKIRSLEPSMICISDLGSDAERISRFSSLAKEQSQSKIVVGGYVTINNEAAFERDRNIDAYCIGSGFYLDRLIQHYECGYPANDIPNFFVRHNGVLVRNRLDGDSHFCDFKERDLSIYRQHPLVYHSVFPFIMASYGCIRNCSFCFYSGFEKIFGKRAPLCFKDPDLVVREINQIRQINRHFRCFCFVDDNIMNNIDWLNKLMSAIKPLGIRFLAKIDVNSCTEEMIRMMHEAGLFAVAIGIEHIDQNVRSSLLNKHFTNEKLIKVLSWLKKYGVHMRIYFIVGLPNESLESISENVSFARRYGLKEVKYTFLRLQPHTVLTERIKEEYGGADLGRAFPFSATQLTGVQMHQNPIFLPGAPLYLSQLIRKIYIFCLKIRYYPFGLRNLIFYGWNYLFYYAKEYVLNAFDSVKNKNSTEVKENA
jgi:radical SAM superfamily enzyme YgiQ (UPF0313 family)